MKISAVSPNNRKKCFEIVTDSKSFTFPYTKLDNPPTADNPIERFFVDKELGNEAFTYVLKDGSENSVLLDQILDYHQDPKYMSDMLLYKLTVEAKKRIDEGKISIRNLARIMGTSPAQLYRLTDTTNYNKSINKVLLLLHFLGCEVDLTVRNRKNGAM